MTKLLCVGGIRDGEWLEISDQDRNLVARVTYPVCGPSAYGDALPAVSLAIYDRVYERSPWRGGEKIQCILVPEGQSPDETLAKLIAGYRATSSSPPSPQPRVNPPP